RRTSSSTESCATSSSWSPSATAPGRRPLRPDGEAGCFPDWRKLRRSETIGTMSELNGDRSAWLRCYRCWSQNLEIQIHYDAIRRVEPNTGIPTEGLDEVQEAVVQCLDCMHDQPHLVLQDNRVIPVEDRWARMVAGA